MLHLRLSGANGDGRYSFRNLARPNRFTDRLDSPRDASKSVSASTHAVCSMPSMSVTETRKEKVGTLAFQEKKSPFVRYLAYLDGAIELTVILPFFISPFTVTYQGDFKPCRTN